MKIKRFTDGGCHGELGFMCPGCKAKHFINDKETEGAKVVWEFNNDFNKPTIRASILTRWFEWNPTSKKYDLERGRCHSYITDGKIRFLMDCDHELAGQTVELPEIN